MHSPRTGGVEYDVAGAVADAENILAINGRALFRVFVLGVLGCGGYGLLLIGVNGYAIGRTLAVVFRIAPDAFWFMLSYAPLEFAAIMAVNCAAQLVTWSCFDWLRERPTPHLGPALRLVGCALLLAVVAAGLEAHAIQSYRSTFE